MRSPGIDQALITAGLWDSKFHSCRNVMGYNADIDILTAPQSVWQVIAGGVLAKPVAGVLTMTPTHVNDTIAGTGAQKVTFYGVDAAYNLVSEELDTAGAAPTVGTQVFQWVYEAVVTQVGTGLTNAGNIDYTVGGLTMGVIIAAESKSRNSFSVVPAGKVGLISVVDTSLQVVGGAAGSGVVNLMAETEGGTKQVLRGVSPLQTYVRPFMPYMLIEEQTIITGEVASVAVDNSQVGFNYDLMLFTKPA